MPSGRARPRGSRLLRLGSRGPVHAFHRLEQRPGRSGRHAVFAQPRGPCIVVEDGRHARIVLLRLDRAADQVVGRHGGHHAERQRRGLALDGVAPPHEGEAARPAVPGIDRPLPCLRPARRLEDLLALVERAEDDDAALAGWETVRQQLRQSSGCLVLLSSRREHSGKG